MNYIWYRRTELVSYSRLISNVLPSYKTNIRKLRLTLIDEQSNDVVQRIHYLWPSFFTVCWILKYVGIRDTHKTIQSNKACDFIEKKNVVIKLHESWM